MRQLLTEGEHVRLEEEPGIVWIVRTDSRPDSPAELAKAFRELNAFLRPEHHDGGVVMDMRAATGKNDAAWEDGLRADRMRAFDTFARAVVLVRTAAGRLQVQRLARDENRPVFVTDDEAEAARLAKGS